jgi:uncharacterized membrane protein
MRRAARAQALVWLTVAMPLFVAITGLAIDGAVLLVGRRQLQSVADGAARAGATQLDHELLRGSAGSQVQLEPAAARSAALGYLGEHVGRELPWVTPPVWKVDVTRQRVHVVVEGGLRTAFMRVVRVESVPVAASSFADVQYGIREPSGG